MHTDEFSPEVIQEIREKIASLQQEIDARQARVASWQRFLDLARTTASRQLPFAGVGRFSSMSAVDATEIVLKEEGRPLRVSEMLPLLEAGGWTSNAKMPTANLSAMLQRCGKFVKKAPGVYGLPSEEAEAEAEEETKVNKVPTLNGPLAVFRVD